MRRQGASIFIYLIFGLLVAIFVININPGQKGGGGCGSRSNLVVDVAGARANNTAFQIAYASHLNVGQQKSKEQIAIDSLIRREILASAAADRGIRVTPEQVQEEVKKGIHFTHLPPYRQPLHQWPVSPSGRFQMGENIFSKHPKDEAGKDCEPLSETNLESLLARKCLWWDQRKFASWVNSLNVSKPSYLDEQARSMQATLMADLLADSVRVSRDEAHAEWLFEKNTATYDVVTFSPDTYKGLILLTEQNVNKYIELHKDEVEKKYKDEAPTYKATKPSVRIRQLYVYAPPDPVVEEPAPPAPAPGAGSGSGSAEAPAPAAGSGSGAGSGSATPPPPPPAPKKWVKGEEVKAKVLAAKQAIEAGRKKWAEVVKEMSTDEAPKYNAGDKGWKPRENTSLGSAELNNAVKDLKVGQLSEPVLVEGKGVYMFLVEDERQGDLTFDQVKYELAVPLATAAWSKEKAKREALAALAKATEGGGKALDTLFELELKKLDMEFLQDPTVPAEEKQEYLRRVQRRGALDHPIVIEGKDVPAASKADADGSSSGSASGSGSGSAAAGSATAPATTPAKPAIPEIVPTTDPLPEFERFAPKDVRYENEGRRPSMPGVGKLTALLFDELREGQVAKRVYEQNDVYVVIQLVKKGQPVEGEFEKDAERYIEELRVARSRTVIDDFLYNQCTTLVREKKITTYRGDEHDDNGNVTRKFSPCFTFAGPHGLAGAAAGGAPIPHPEE
ncbi:MAG: SurA N-terminal domain-containing protein [Deltaproteobacteria bacterium]|nr:SurA N-terminal domain-containing protein [Deltaproteobacteria bacterium]